MSPVLRDTGTKTKDALNETQDFAELERDTHQTGKSSDDVSLIDLLIVIGRRKKFLAVSTIAVGILTLIVTLVIPNRYTAIITVLPRGGIVPELGPVVTSGQPGSSRIAGRRQPRIEESRRHDRRPAEKP